MYRKLPIGLDANKEWFNLLLTVLHEHTLINPYEEYRNLSGKLINKFMTYGRAYTSKANGSCVLLPMYPSESRDVVCLLLMSLARYYDIDKDYSSELNTTSKQED